MLDFTLVPKTMSRDDRQYAVAGPGRQEFPPRRGEAAANLRKTAPRVFSGLFRRRFVTAILIYLISSPAVQAGSGQNSAGSADIPATIHSDLISALYDDAVFITHLRTFLYDQRSDTGADPAAWAAGGWIGYETGWIGDILKLGAVGYTSQPLWAPKDRSGSLLLSNDQQGYAVLGQGYAAVKVMEQTATFYRQLVLQPEVNPHDNLMTPNTFEGITVKGGEGAFSYFAGVLSRMKTRNSSEFQNFGKAAGVEPTDGPILLGGVDLTRDENSTIRASVYVAPDHLASGYMDATWKTSLSQDISLTLDGQFMYQGSMGDDLLTGCRCQTWVAGAQAALTFGDLTFTGGLTQTGSAADYASPFGACPGYTSIVVQNFDRADESTVLAGLASDFSSRGLDGLAFSTLAAVDVHTADRADCWQEIDVSLTYGFNNLNEEWSLLAPLRLRAFYAYVDLGSSSTLDQLQIILDYEYQFGGKDKYSGAG